MVTVVARIMAKKGSEENLRIELLKLIEPTRREPGCINYDLHESDHDRGSFLFYENWKTRKDVEIHLMSHHVQSILKRAEIYLARPVELTYWNRLSEVAK